MLTIELNMYHAVALGAFLFWLGGIITDKISLLNRYCIPAPLVGGLSFSILNCILYSMGVASITFDATLQTVFMIMFFTTVGFTVSIPALLKGGKAVMLCLAISIMMIPLQNFLGGGVMALFGRARCSASAAAPSLWSAAPARRQRSAPTLRPLARSAAASSPSRQRLSALWPDLSWAARRPSVSSKSTICVPLR